MSTRRRREAPPPPKKKKTGLIIGLIIAIILVIIIVVVVILVLRARANTPPAGKCFSTPDCPSGKICDTTSETCVSCLSDANCSGVNKTCDASTKTCVACLSDANCSGATPACNVVNKTCVACLSDANCSGSTPACNVVNKTCVACLSDANCSGTTPNCDVTNKTCVECLSTSDCSGNEICDTANKTCVPPECEINSDCGSDPSKKACSSGTCAQCTANADCSSSAIHSQAGKNFCDVSTSTCVICTTAADCGGGASTTCSGGVCCNLTPPQVASCVVTLSSISTITGTYLTAISGFGAKAVIKLMSSTGTVIYTSPEISANGAIDLTETGMSISLFPLTSYKVAVKLIYSCGSTAFSPDFSITMPKSTLNASNIPYPDASGNGNLPNVISKSSSASAGVSLTLKDGVVRNGRILLSKVADFHPNDATVDALVAWPGGISCPSNFGCPNATFTAPWGSTFAQNGEVWYYVFVFNSDSSAPGITGIMSNMARGSITIGV